MATTEKERRNRRDQVIDMVTTGYSYQEIADRLGLRLSLVKTDVAVKRKEMLAEMDSNTSEIIARFERDTQKRLKQLWTVVLDLKVKQGNRLRALQLLQNEEELGIRRRQLIGLLPRDAPLVAVQNNTQVVTGGVGIAETVRREFPELVEKFGVNKALVKKEKKEG